MNEPVLEIYEGVLEITPQCPGVPPFRREGTWKRVEDPEHPGQFYWVSGSASFGTGICEKVG